jgi:trk system potassium uptake protein TrkH
MFGSHVILPLLAALRNPERSQRARRPSPVQVIALGLLAIIAVGAALLVLPISQRDGQQVGWLDCLFTATSAACVTGLVTHSTADTWSTFGQMVILVLIQIGGIGYMSLATIMALIMGVRLGVRARLSLKEAHGVFTLHDATVVTKYVILGTLVVESIGALLLMLRFHYHHAMSWGHALYEGVFYSISAFCNAGFDLAPGFLGLAFLPYRTDMLLLVIIGVLVILGGLGFAVMAEVGSWPRTRRMTLYVKLVLTVTVWLILFGMAFFILFEFRNPQTLAELDTSWQKVVTSWFMSVTPRTAGFTPVDLSQATPPTLFITSLLMIIGGSPNSTAGGVKTTTIAIIILAIAALVRNRQDIEVFRRRIGGEMVRLALSLLGVYLLAISLVVIGLSISEITLQQASPHPQAMTRFSHLLFETVSAFGTVGLSAGVTPTLNPVSRVLIILGMYLGRLGPLTFIFIFAGGKRPQLRRLPSEQVMAG